ncbi:MAG: response regulator transcription factor [Desulfobacterales bacterium]|nr:response regulator transcription factor [Desulfobacterales bacterium]
MNNIKAVIADDEPELRIYLKTRLAEVWPDLLIGGEAGNGRDALNLIEELRPEIAFLDIKMPGLSGMDVAGRITGPCHVVFVTAYDQYAVEAFENEAVDYLLKPISAKRLSQTVDRLKKRLAATAEAPPDLSEIVARVMERIPGGKAPEHLRWIRVQHGDGVRIVSVDEVRYFKAADKYTMVVTLEGEHLIRKPIRDLVEELNPEVFWRIHRGVIVNVRAIDKVSRSITGRCILKLKAPPESLTVSRSYAHLFKQM